MSTRNCHSSDSQALLQLPPPPLGKSFLLCVPRRERMLQSQCMWLRFLLQHPGGLQVRLPLGLLLRPVLQRLPWCQRVLVLQEPLQLWLLQHRRGLPLWLPARLLPSGTGVRPPTSPRWEASAVPALKGKLMLPGGKRSGQRTWDVGRRTARKAHGWGAVESPPLWCTWDPLLYRCHSPAPQNGLNGFTQIPQGQRHFKNPAPVLSLTPGLWGVSGMASPEIFLWILASANPLVPKEGVVPSLSSSGCIVHRAGVPGQRGTTTRLGSRQLMAPSHVSRLKHIGGASHPHPSFKAAGPHTAQKMGIYKSVKVTFPRRNRERVRHWGVRTHLSTPATW